MGGLTAKDIHWLAGFLDGEGYFGAKATTISVVAVQKDEWHMRHVQSLVGGNVYRYENKPKGKPSRWYWRWEAHGSLAAGVMMTVLSLMSPRRQEKIKGLIAWWRAKGLRGGHYRNRTHCKHGHEYTPENTYARESTGNARYCKSCDTARKNAHYLRSRTLAF